MNAVMDLHHKLVRKLLDQHGGYESDTEGDSFIVAFASPWGALAFAEVRALPCTCLCLFKASLQPRIPVLCIVLQDLQRSLMKLPWPTELLQSNVVARAMWAQVWAVRCTPRPAHEVSAHSPHSGHAPPVLHATRRRARWTWLSCGARQATLWQALVRRTTRTAVREDPAAASALSS